jgi:hypothetical protein
LLTIVCWKLRKKFQQAGNIQILSINIERKKKNKLIRKTFFNNLYSEKYKPGDKNNKKWYKKQIKHI